MNIYRSVTQLSTFAKDIEKLIRARKILQSDFEDFKRTIVEHPELGDIIQGTGGVRKIRMKSASAGKRGGFRVCYYFHDVDAGEVFLISIYAKNEKEDLTHNEKKELHSLVNIIKGK